MRLQLDDRWISHLCGLPETGMGFQRVDIALQSGEVLTGVVVFNAEEVEWPADRPPIRPLDIAAITLSDESAPG